MRVHRTVAVLALVGTLFAVWPCLAQDTAASAVRSRLTDADMEQFLLGGKIVAMKEKGKGVTDARRVTLSDGRVTHDAQIQDVDIAKAIFDVDPKHTEVNFKDTYRYNVAAYRLSRLLGLDNVPMSVEREYSRKPAAFTWWIDDVAMDEGARQKAREKAVGPNALRTIGYVQIMRVFDELIQNRDRNAGNLLWTKDWKMWMIDHTRAFRLGKDLLMPGSLERCERTLYEKMQTLTAPTLSTTMGHNLTKDEIEALLARRDRLVTVFKNRIAQKTEAAVLYTLPE